MKIMVVAVAASSEMSGVQRHAFNAVRCLLLRSEISAVHLVVAPWQRKLVQSANLELNNVPGQAPSHRLIIHLAEMNHSPFSRNLWYYRELPQLAREQRVDLVHLAYPTPINRAALACPTVVTLHDLYPYEIPSNFGWRQVLFNRLILQQCLRRVDAIACVSETTADRLRLYVPPVVWRKSMRIYNCVEQGHEDRVPTSRNEAPIQSWEGEPFLLCVAQHRRNKNIPLLIRSIAHLLSTREIDSQMKLMVVGIIGPETQRIRRQIIRSNLNGRVHLLEGISETELQWCYTHCAALVVPSSTEGFGLPIVEGLLAGCRIVCTDIPAFREVSEGNCNFVPLSQRMEGPLASEIAAALRMPPPLPMALPQFSASALAEQYVELYRKLTSSTSLTTFALASPISSVLGSSHSKEVQHEIS
jgi:glycosyltransferase involved in cell wall biosynthesis